MSNAYLIAEVIYYKIELYSLGEYSYSRIILDYTITS